MPLWKPAPLILLVTAVLVGTSADIAVGRTAPPVPAERPGRGLIYDGLQPATDGGPCDPGHEGHFEIRSNGGRLLGCTHGPDPAPAGENLASPSTPALRSDGVAHTESVPCIGDGVSGYRVQAVYAHPADMASRYGVVAAAIHGYAAANVDDVVAASAAETGGSRRVRFVTDGSCQLDVDEVRLSATGDDTFSNTINELRGLGYTRADRKYLVWMDTPAGRSSVYCGIGQLYYDETDAVTNLNNGRASIQGMFARVDAGCWGSNGTPVEAHELMHNLGGVQRNAPHSTNRFPSPAGGHCTDDYDVMCYDDDGSGPATATVACSSTIAERRFDCGHDDYFSTSPVPGSYLDTHWNSADSRFLDASQPIGVANDAFASAQDLEGGVVSTVGTTVGATREAGEPNHAGQAGGASVWYRWRAPAGGPVTVRTVGSSFDTLLAVYSGNALGGLSVVTAGDDVSVTELTSEATFDATAGTAYRIAVDGYEGDVGAVALAIAPGDASGSAGGGGQDSMALKASRKRVRPGTRVRLTVADPGCRPGEEIEVVSGSRLWAGRLGSQCTEVFRSKVTRKMTFRAVAYDQSGHAVARSKPLTVKVRIP
jgi:hypothetical protein